MNRSQLKRAYLDVDFFNQPKIRAGRRIFGKIFPLILIDIYLAMSKATNAIIDKDAILSIIEDYDIEDAESVLIYCLHPDRKLIHIELHGYTNSVVVKDQEQYHKKLKKKPKGDESEDFSGKNFPNKEEKSQIPDTDSDYDNDSVVDDLKKEKADKKETDLPGFDYTLPASYSTPEIRNAIKRCAGKIKQSGRILDPIMLESKIISMGNPQRFLAALNYTAGLSKSKNIISDPEYEKSTTQPHEKRTNYDRNKEQILKSLKESKDREQRTNS